jgi:hypothetical protein
MALPLAHPAAVLPLRRWCPRYFSFPALVVGSLSPDLAYLSGPFELDRYSHQLVGAMVSGLVFGGLVLLGWRLTRRRLVSLLPERVGRVVKPWGERPLGAFWVILLSLAIGALTHWLVDAVTHKDGWIVARLPLLGLELMQFGPKTVRVCQVLWHGGSLVGVVWLALVFQTWWREASGSVALASVRTRWIHALVLGAVTAPIAVVHHLFAPLPIQIAAGAFMAVFMAGLAWWVVRLP